MEGLQQGRWWEIDPAYRLLLLLESHGLVWNLKLEPAGSETEHVIPEHATHVLEMILPLLGFYVLGKGVANETSGAHKALVP